MIGTDNKGEFVLYKFDGNTKAGILRKHNAEASTITPYDERDIQEWEVYYNPIDEEWHFIDDLEYDEDLTLDQVKESITKAYALKL